MCWQHAVPTRRPRPEPDCGLRKGWSGWVPVSLTFPGTHLNITVSFLIGLFFPFLFFRFCSLLFKCLAGYANIAAAPQGISRPQKPLQLS